MPEIIEMNEIVVDAYNAELRVGDRVSLAFTDEQTGGVVVKLTKPGGDILLAGEGVEVEQQPVVTVRLDNGVEVELVTEFLRLASWRWSCAGLQRRQQLPREARGFPQGADL